MADRSHSTSFVRHAWVFGVLTLVSRVSGLLRDMVFSRVLGTSGVMSAWTTAFLIPNVFRRLFGEGALAAAFIPEYARLAQRDARTADQLASLTVSLMVLVLGAAALVLEGVLAVLLLATPLGETAREVLLFAMVMLPYMPLVCVTAILGGMLQSHGRFAPGAAAPVILNVCMIAGAVLVGASAGASLFAISLGVSVSVVVAGVAQAGWCLWALRGHVRWTRARDGAREAGTRMLRSMVPVLIGMGAFQMGTLVDGLLAGWPKIFGPGVPLTDARYPLDESAASVLYYAQRLYQFPLGVFGIAIATAVFPSLSRLAGDEQAFTRMLRKGVRLSLFIGLPASLGLLLVREEITGVIYSGGRFGDEQVRRVALALLAYTPGIWAYSLTQLLTRAFYARGLMGVPMRVGIATVLTNIALNLALIVPLKEAGLALATSLSAIGQCLALLVLGGRRLTGSHLWTGELRAAGAWTLGLTLVMGACVLGAGRVLPVAAGAGPLALGVRLGVLCLVGGAVYLAGAALARRAEVRWLAGSLAGRRGTADEGSNDTGGDGR